MDKSEAQAQKAVALNEVADIEADITRLVTKREARQQLIAAYDRIIAAEDGEVVPAVVVRKLVPLRPITFTTPVVKASRSTENSTVRVTRLLKASAPKHLTTRQILEKLLEEGWETQSVNKINVVRSVMADLNKRFPEITRRSNRDGTKGYGWDETRSKRAEGVG